MRNVVQNSKVPPGAGKAGGVAVEEGGTGGGWKVHLAQDNKTGLQRPSRTFSYPHTASQSYTTLSYLFSLLTSYFLQLQYLNTISQNITLSLLWSGFEVLMRSREQRSS